MTFFSQEDIEQARKIDLFTYLWMCDSNELVHLYGETYCTRQHDSLKISNGKWMWWSRGIGGATALDYLVKVRGIPFIQAVGMILGKEALKPPLFSSKTIGISSKRLLLPDESPSAERVEKYLKGRAIDKEIIRNCIREKLLYESLPYHNCIFVGYDDTGVARYASFRSTGKERFLGEATGSDKRYSFRIGLGGQPGSILSRAPGSTLHVFESAIDLLSFATMRKHLGSVWNADPMLSLGGVHVPRRDGNSRIPIALTEYPGRNFGFSAIALHLDNDFAGRRASKMLMEKLKGEYQIRDEPPLYGKDMNDELLRYVGLLANERKG